MVMFNSYVKLPEGMPYFYIGTSHLSSGHLERALAAKHQRRSSQLLQELGASVPEAAKRRDGHGHVMGFI